MSMYVVPDANVFIADPWFRSQRWRVLLNFLARTGSHLVMLSPVESEIRAHMIRNIDQAAANLESALYQAQRQGLANVPVFDPDDARAATQVHWEKALTEALSRIPVERPALAVNILPEAIRRATQRIPPCDAAGKELRDTIIWLSLIEFSRGLPEDSSIAFLSQNTKDFGGADGASLKADLLADVAELGRALTYFPSLETFNKAHADRVAYLTIEWVRTHLGNAPIQRLVAAHLLTIEPAPYLRIVNGEYADYYEPRETLSVDFASLDIDDVHVWRTLPHELELRIDFSTDVQAEVEADLVHRPSHFWHREYNDEFDDEYPSSKVLACVGELSGVIAARIINDASIDAVDLEDLHRR